MPLASPPLLHVAQLELLCVVACGCGVLAHLWAAQQRWLAGACRSKGMAAKKREGIWRIRLCDAAGHPEVLAAILRCCCLPCVASGHPALLLVTLCCFWPPYVAGHLQPCAAVVLAGAWTVQLLLAALLQPQAWDFTWPLTASSSGDTHS